MTPSRKNAAKRLLSRGKRNDFLRYHLNRWTNQATAWIPIDWWDACATTLDDADLVGLDAGAGWTSRRNGIWRLRRRVPESARDADRAGGHRDR